MNYYPLTLKLSKISEYTLNKKGELQNAYSPLQNLISDTGLGDFTSKYLHFNKYTPIDIIVSDEYDGSLNLIINDDTNVPKLINSRFSVLENKTFNIPEHLENAVTNVYEDSVLDQKTNLLKLYNKIPKLQFNGIGDGGAFNCGSYTFYFKLADADGNVTNIIQESGIIQVHIGETNSKKVRMGLQDERANKTISFTLSGIDSGFDYVRIFYEKTSSDLSLAKINSFFMIDQNYPIIGLKCDILLTGDENVLQISDSDIKNEFADIQTAKTQEIHQNILFLGNITAYEQDYKKLLEIAWKIIPEQVTTNECVGGIDGRYNQVISPYGYKGSYYNVNNVYNFVGYWPDEYYRFGVVFIYENNILSPVFNIQGCDFQKIDDLRKNDPSLNIEKIFFKKTSPRYEFWDTDTEDHIFKKLYMTNSKGVVHFSNNLLLNINSETLYPKVLSIRFDLSKIGMSETASTDKTCFEVLKENKIKGLFFVRQKRIPTILALGLVIGLTGKEHGSIPVIKSEKGSWITKSFLRSDRILAEKGSTINISSKVYNKALLVPDAELQESAFSLLFTSLNFLLTKIGLVLFKEITSDVMSVKDYIPDSEYNKYKSKVTLVQKDTKINTDGTNYFSTVAGSPEEPYKTADVNNVWTKTPPQSLTVSTSLIRGKWGSYVGISSEDLSYGDIVNIKNVNFEESPNTNELEFLKRFNDFSLYSAISSRYNFDDQVEFNCYRGDCYPSMFTHRMMTNFMDPELPTNTKIVDPGCWAKNYAVRSSAWILNNTKSNLMGDSGGWYLPDPGDRKSAIVSIVFGILTGNIGTMINAASSLHLQSSYLDTYANEIAQAFEIYIGLYIKTKDDKDVIDHDEILDSYKDCSNLKDLLYNGYIKKVTPQKQEANASGLNLKAIFKASDKWELHGLASINRADVNAVSFGQWITFPICSSMNLAFRDVDYLHASELATVLKKRSFYPYDDFNVYEKIPESNAINIATKKSLSTNQNVAFTQIPYIKLEYFNRIYWSKPNIAQNFINSYRFIFKDQYHDYNKEFGAITKIISVGDSLIVVFDHGIGLLPVNRSPQSTLESSPYLPSKSVLPSLISILTRDYGSMWKDSILKSPNLNAVYGVDTVAKKIWRTNGGSVEFISNFKVLKFLNDWIDLSEYNFNVYQGHINVKTHYNAFKQDVIFTYYKDIPMSRYEYIKNPKTLEYEKLPIGSLWHYTNEWELNKTNVEDVEYKEVDLSGNLILDDTLDPKILIEKWEPGKTWSLCFNEVKNNFVTFYDWYPIESCNIDNIFFSFDKDLIDDVLNKSVKSDSIYVHPDATFTVPEGINKLTTNKVFIDKINTCIVDYYVNNSSSKKTISINAPSSYTISGKNPKLYLSFYIKRQASYTIGDFIESGAFGYTYDASETPWKLMRKQIALGSKVDIIVPNDTSIANIHFTEIDEDKCSITTSGPFAYLELRDTETNKMFLWKHGLAGLYDNLGRIKPTNWYGKQHEFNFEFVVNELPTVLKIFNNLKLISNKTEPNKFEYEVVGEGYEWFELKPVIQWINDKYNENTTAKGSEKETFEYWYKEVLTKKYSELTNTYLDFPELFGKDDEYKLQKLPFLHLETADRKGLTDKNKTYSDTDYWTPLSPNNDFDYKYSFNTSETILVEDELLNEQRVHTELLGNDMKKYGRIRGNMLYLEDLWDIEIRPVLIKWAYINGTELKFTSSKETRHRDKYIKIKVRYTGKDLAVILGIITMFDISYA